MLRGPPTAEEICALELMMKLWVNNKPLEMAKKPRELAEILQTRSENNVKNIINSQIRNMESKLEDWLS